MKSLLVILGITLTMAFNTSVSLKKDGQTDILDKLTVQSDRVTECKESKCILTSLDKIQTYKTYVIIYKKGEKWIVDRNSNNYNKLLKTYKTKSIHILEGHIRVSEIDFPDQQYVVILQ